MSLRSVTNKIFPRKREENGATNRLFRQEDNMKHKTLVCLALAMMLIAACASAQQLPSVNCFSPGLLKVNGLENSAVSICPNQPDTPMNTSESLFQISHTTSALR